MKSPDKFERLRHYSTPTIVRALTQATGDPPHMTDGSLRPLFADRSPVIGRAVTATLAAAATAQPRATIAADILDYLTERPGPVIAIVHDETGDAGCIWDKATAQLAATLGCVGVVTDGEATDIAAVAETGLYVLANGPTLPNYHVELTGISQPVVVAGMSVEAGQIVHADRHGAVVVPDDLVPSLPGIADQLLDSHSDFVDWLTSRRRSPSELADHLRNAADRPQRERNRHWWHRT